jgi:hypothetical protein
VGWSYRSRSRAQHNSSRRQMRISRPAQPIRWEQRRLECAIAVFSKDEAVEARQEFGLQKHGQLLVEMGRPDESEVVLLRIGKPKPFAFYWLKAQLAQGKHDAAMAAIDNALDGLVPGQARFQPTFLAHRFEVRCALSDPAARGDLTEAHRLCEDPKYKAALGRRLADC